MTSRCSMVCGRWQLRGHGDDHICAHVLHCIHRNWRRKKPSTNSARVFTGMNHPGIRQERGAPSKDFREIHRSPVQGRCGDASGMPQLLNVVSRGLADSVRAAGLEASPIQKFPLAKIPEAVALGLRHDFGDGMSGGRRTASMAPALVRRCSQLDLFLIETCSTPRCAMPRANLPPALGPTRGGARARRGLR